MEKIVETISTTTSSTKIKTFCKALPKLVASAAILFPISTTTLQAEIPTDLEIQSSRLSMNAYEVNLNDHEIRYIKSLIAKDYPTPSIILHGIGRGLPINDIVYHLVKSDPESGLEIYQQAMNLLPSLPGWVCEQSIASNNRFYERYSLGQLGSSKSIQAVADRYFGSNARLGEQSNSKGDLQVDIDELIGIANREKKGSTGDAWWYVSAKSHPAAQLPVLVSLYQKDNQMVVDADIDALKQRKASGTETAPVKFIYNARNLLPTSQVESAVAKAVNSRIGAVSLGNYASGRYIDTSDRRTSVSEVLYIYAAERLRVTPPREWRELDHHVNAKTSELIALFPIPEKSSIPVAKWNKINRQLQSTGFEKPVMITVYGDTMERWIDDAEWIAVANSLGIKYIPTVFFYHETERYTCESPAACGAGICGSALAAGAKIGSCKPVVYPPPPPSSQD
ncbi:hypothetical protein [Solemya elarraichensis gill symbiont]|uniref:Uncharacterized protein n=1 Tax=Solemya elarraichensis gill symbiont TaxID=1918949 RepID=A0A1T2L0R6_9GAMM|nr:hypothetical protein [Solemya elarraichensis gill symbiont]OOZ38668.1 hypothetical protein BOW52_08180 [Solemya elarraichensis gill symbiont]